MIRRLFVLVFTILAQAALVAAQDRPEISVGIESTVFASMRTNVDTNIPCCIGLPQVWEPMEQAVTFEVKYRKFTVHGKFGFSGTIAGPAETINPDGVRQRGSVYQITGYRGDVRERSLSIGYALNRHIEVEVRCLSLSHEEKTEYFQPSSFDGAGLGSSYESRNHFSGIGLGARGHYTTGRLTLHAAAAIYPRISHHEETEQFYLGTFTNEREHSAWGGEFGGGLSYELARHLEVTWEYQVQAIRSELPSNDSSITRWRRSPSIGLRLRF